MEVLRVAAMQFLGIQPVDKDVTGDDKCHFGASTTTLPTPKPPKMVPDDYLSSNMLNDSISSS